MPLPSRLIWAAPLALSGCVASGTLPDPQTVTLAASLQADAQNFYAALSSKSAPQCSYEQNMNNYANLANSAAALRARITTSGGSAARLRAADALTRVVANARASHMLASAHTGDRYGPCMAPGAMALNADAIARASAALSATASTAGDQ